MIETMHRSKGIGLAGPQVALGERIIIVNPGGERGTETVMLNPEIIARLGEQEGEEGCLSVPGAFAVVRRALEITVRYLALDGKMVTENRSELSARVAQHEIDHLDGILFFQRLSPAEKTKVARRLKELEDLHRSRTAAR
jgi:peptide deformylase